MATMDMGRLAESLVVKGDLSGLSPTEKAKVYIATCERLGLNPQTQPFQMLKLNGKEILYASRGATDQLAAIHKLTREIIEGPEVRDFGGTKLLYCKAKVSHPNGRVETSVATLPPRVDENSLMKLETKAKRRATLSILGLGMLDEVEVESIPARSKAPAEQVHIEYTAFDELRDCLADCESVAEIFEHDRIYTPRVIDRTDRTQQDVMGACMDRLAEMGYPIASDAAYKRWFEASSTAEFAQFFPEALRLETIDELLAFWRQCRDGVKLLTTELQQLAWKVLCDRADQISPPDGKRQTGNWLKAKLVLLDAPPPSGGGSAKPVAANDAADDPEREAIVAEGAEGPAASAWREKVSAVKSLPHARNLWSKHRTDPDRDWRLEVMGVRMMEQGIATGPRDVLAVLGELNNERKVA